MKKLLLALLIPSGVLAQQCIVQTKTVSASNVVIAERSGMTRITTPEINGRRTCRVTFRARINNEWHTAFGDSPIEFNNVEQACDIAERRAEAEVKNRAVQRRVATEDVMVCTDQTNLELLKRNDVGTIGEVGQFRPHPDMPRDFAHNGTRCRFFVDTQFVHQNVNTYQGVICQVQGTRWVVVDKF